MDEFKFLSTTRYNGLMSKEVISLYMDYLNDPDKNNFAKTTNLAYYILTQIQYWDGRMYAGVIAVKPHQDPTMKILFYVNNGQINSHEVLNNNENETF